MHEEQKEMKQLDTGWRVILVIWGAIFVSLGVYLAVCIIMEKELQFDLDPNFPIETIKFALFGVSFITLFVVHYLRKFLFKTNSPIITPRQALSPQQQALGKYSVIVIITLALLDSIGIYGVVLFIMSKDTLSLYQLLIISAVAMIHFRPRKEELLNLVAKTEAQWEKHV